jgi:shikimate dehydrogenase
MTVRGTTRIAGVVGCPIAHTRSPAMHNYAYAKTGLDMIYLPFLVREKELGRAMAGVRALNMAGVNVTIPHKQAVIRHLDTVSKESKLIGAVNTVVNRDGRLFGTTTDPHGIMMALKRKKVSIAGKRITILGTGGSARTALFTFLLNGCRDIAIAGRRPARASAMSREAGKRFHRRVPLLKLETPAFARRMAGTDLLVNCTSAGMVPNAGKTPVKKNLLRRGMAVFDIVYQPEKTRLLKEAAEAGLKTVGGMDMLIFQGMAAFKLFTGKSVPYDVFRKGFDLA